MSHAGQYSLGFNASMGKYRAKLIKEVFESKVIKNILDIGCGTGDVLASLAGQSKILNGAKNITLVDFNKGYLTQARRQLRKYKQASYIHSSIESLELSNEYDLVIIIDVLEHAANPLDILKRAKGYLNKSGFILVIVPNAKSLHRFIGKDQKLINRLDELSAIDVRVGHKRYFDMGKLTRLCHKAGLKIVDKRGILLKPVPNVEMAKLEESLIEKLYEAGKVVPEYCAEIAVVLTR